MTQQSISAALPVKLDFWFLAFLILRVKLRQLNPKKQSSSIHLTF